jgi:hypothetical protein
MEQVDHATVVSHLTAIGTPKSEAVQYADAFCEYQEASKNISEHGVIVLHPRTSTPIENPYLQIRDRALRKLQGMRSVKADSLW